MIWKELRRFQPIDGRKHRCWSLELLGWGLRRKKLAYLCLPNVEVLIVGVGLDKFLWFVTWLQILLSPDSSIRSPSIIPHFAHSWILQRYHYLKDLPTSTSVWDSSTFCKMFLSMKGTINFAYLQQGILWLATDSRMLPLEKQATGDFQKVLRWMGFRESEPFFWRVAL